MGSGQYIDVCVGGFTALPALFVSKCGFLRWVGYVGEIGVGPHPGCAQ